MEPPVSFFGLGILPILHSKKNYFLRWIFLYFHFVPPGPPCISYSFPYIFKKPSATIFRLEIWSRPHVYMYCTKTYLHEPNPTYNRSDISPDTWRGSGAGEGLVLQQILPYMYSFRVACVGEVNRLPIILHQNTYFYVSQNTYFYVSEYSASVSLFKQGNKLEVDMGFNLPLRMRICPQIVYVFNAFPN